jgi:hypothetical protein
VTTLRIIRTTGEQEQCPENNKSDHHALTFKIRSQESVPLASTRVDNTWPPAPDAWLEMPKASPTSTGRRHSGRAL